jgi:acyl carrier protein
VLEDLLDGKTLDFCLLVSSLTSMLGGIGHAAYASSNVYMDSFVRRHNRSHRRPWLSVNFDLWRFPDRDAIAAGFGKTVQDLGHSPEEAIAATEALLRLRNAGQILISTGDLAARLNQWIRLESLDGGQRTAASLPAPSARSSAQPPDAKPRDETEQCIARIWQEALGVEVGINDSFTRVGGHSLLAIRIVSELRKAFQIDLPVKALFEAPTVAELSIHIKNRLIADIDALTDEEAERLVSSEDTVGGSRNAA